MSQTITRKVVPLLGVLAMLLALLVPQTTAFAEDIGEGSDETTDATDDAEDTESAEGEPADGAPIEDEPTDGDPSEAEPVDGEPVEGEPTDGEPVEGESTASEPTDIVEPETNSASDDGDDPEPGRMSAALTPASVDRCTNGEGVTAQINETDGVPTGFTLDFPSSGHRQTCFIWLSSYNVPATWNGTGFNATAAPQEAFDHVKVVLERGSEKTVAIGNGDGELAIPDCGPYQIDAYRADDNGEPLEVVVHPTGHKRLISGAGELYQQPTCDVQLNVISECRFIDGDATEYLWRVVRTDGNELVPNVDWRVEKSGRPIESGSIAPDSTQYFTLSDREVGISIVWGGELTGVTRGSKSTASENQKECAYEVEIEKIWVDANGVEVEAPRSGVLTATTITEAANVGGNGVQGPTQGNEGDTIRVRGDGSYRVDEELADDWFIDVDDERNDGIGTFHLDPLTAETYPSDKTITHTVVNRQLQMDFAKVVCDDYADVPQNESGENPPLGIGGFDLTDGGYADSTVDWQMSGGWLDVEAEVTAAQARGCSLIDWNFELYDNGGTLLQTVAFEAADGIDTITLSGDVLTAALAGRLHVAESFDDLLVETETVAPYFTGGPQEGEYRFGSLRCAQDGVNLDNRETIRLGNAGVDDPIGCVAYNVPATQRVQPFKVWTFGSELNGLLPEGSATITVQVAGEDEVRGTWDFPTSSSIFGPIPFSDAGALVDVPDGPAPEPVFLPRSAELDWGEVYDVDGYDCTPDVMTIEEYLDEFGEGSVVFDAGESDHLRPSDILRPRFPDGTTHVIVNACDPTPSTPPGTPPGTPTTPPTAPPPDEPVEVDPEVGVLPDPGEEADPQPGEESEPEPTVEPEATPEPETEQVVRVRGVAEEATATATAMPRTGASALLLSILGLLGIGLGGVMVRPRRRD